MEQTQLENPEEAAPSTEQNLSKNQLKKLRRRQKWLEIKHERRKEVKLKRKKRLAEMREKGEIVPPTRKSLKSNTMKNSKCKIKVVLDLSLDDFMSEKDIASLTSQIQHSYSANRRADNPMQLYICGLTGKTQKRLDDIGDYKGWDIHVETRDYTEVFPEEDIVYLSSESPNILSSLSDDKVYIIGGLVDHNSHKGLCHRLAEEKGISHAQLPISEYLQLRGRKVLAVNHVFSILLRFTELRDWKQAFLLEMPQRKGFSLKDDGKTNTEGSPLDKEETCSDGEETKETKIEEGCNDCATDAVNEIREEVKVKSGFLMDLVNSR